MAAAKVSPPKADAGKSVTGAEKPALDAGAADAVEPPAPHSPPAAKEPVTAVVAGADEGEQTEAEVEAVEPAPHSPPSAEVKPKSPLSALSGLSAAPSTQAAKKKAGPKKKVSCGVVDQGGAHGPEGPDGPDGPASSIGAIAYRTAPHHTIPTPTHHRPPQDMEKADLVLLANHIVENNDVIDKVGLEIRVQPYIHTCCARGACVACVACVTSAP